MDNQTEKDTNVVLIVLAVLAFLVIVLPNPVLLVCAVIYWICRVGNKIKNGD